VRASVSTVAPTLALGVLIFFAGGELAADEPANSDGILAAPQPIADAVRSRFGAAVRIRSLSVSPESAKIEVQDPSLPENLDLYPFEDGVFGPSEPVQAGRNKRQFEARLFAFADVDVRLIPRLLADARQRAETGDARVVSVVIERSQSYGDSELWGWPVLRFTVDGPRGGAVVEYDLRGKHKRTTRW
jgi:hypothetical protein